MKVFTLTEEQQKENVSLQSAVKAAFEPYQAATAAYKKFVGVVTKGDSATAQSAKVSDDGVSLVLLP